MDRSPPVSLRGGDGDVIGGADGDGRDDRGPGRVRWLGLALAAAVGFAAAQVVAPEPAADAAPSLALVVPRQPAFGATGDQAPQATMEVTLVNTGPSAVRLDGAVVEGSDLAWEADRTLEPGQQLAAVLREQHPCDRAPDVLSGGAGTSRLRVRTTGERDGDGSALSLTMPPTAGRLYDDHVRAVCRLPRLPEALDVVQGEPAPGGDGLALGLVNLSVRPLRVVELTSDLPGLTWTLTDAAGRPVDLPLEVPARTRAQISTGYADGDPATTPYRLRLSLTPEGCAAVRAGTAADGAVDIGYVDPEDPGTTATRPVYADWSELVRRSCP